MLLRVREMVPADIVAAQDLLSQLGYRLEAAAVERRYRAVQEKDDHAVFVAEDAGRVIGLLHVYARPALDKPPEAVVQAIVVDQTYRGEGIGKALMAVAEDWAAERGFRSVALASNVERSGAHAFYGALGYTLAATSHLFRKNFALRLERIVTELPPGFDELREEARATGYRHLERLNEEWSTGVMRFEGAGETLVAARLNGILAGIGGLTIDPAQPDALRMRRFYVRAALRRAGIGRALAEKLIADARTFGRTVTVNAALGSEPFWQSLGFVAEARGGHTHVLRY